MSNQLPNLPASGPVSRSEEPHDRVLIDGEPLPIVDPYEVLRKLKARPVDL